MMYKKGSVRLTPLAYERLISFKHVFDCSTNHLFVVLETYLGKQVGRDVFGLEPDTSFCITDDYKQIDIRLPAEIFDSLLNQKRFLYCPNYTQSHWVSFLLETFSYKKMLVVFDFYYHSRYEVLQKS